MCSFFITLPPQGVGKRYANVCCRKADIDLSKRAGELTEEEVGKNTLLLIILYFICKALAVSF